MSTHNPYASLPKPKAPEPPFTFTLAHSQALVRVQGLAILHGALGLVVATFLLWMLFYAATKADPAPDTDWWAIAAVFGFVAVGAAGLIGSCVGGLRKKRWGLWLGVLGDLFLMLICAPLPLGLWGLWVHLQRSSREVMVPESTRSGWRPSVLHVVAGAVMLALGLCWEVGVYILFHL